MATRYWVGGTGTWNASATTHWSASSGGSSGASVPTSADDVIFNGSSGAGTCSAGSGFTVDFKTLTCTGFTGTLNLDNAAEVRAWGNVVLSSGMTIGGTNFGFNFNATGNLTSAGKTLAFLSTAPGITVSLADAAIIRDIFLIGGTFSTGDQTLTIQNQLVLQYATTLTLGSSVVTFSNIDATANLELLNAQVAGSNLTLSANTSTIKVTTAVGVYFDLLAKTTWNDIWFAPGANAGGNITLKSGGTLANLKCDAGNDLYFEHAKTFTLTSTALNGTAGHLIKLYSDLAGSRFTLSDSSGTNTADYCDIKDCLASGGATFKATHSINSGNNSGIDFGVVPFSRTQRLTYLRR